MRKLRNTFADIYAQKTGQPINIVQNDLERDTFMSAKEAQEYGIIDHIVKNSTEKNDK
jgi:ATP-dependent Clp protease protease subunit